MSVLWGINGSYRCRWQNEGSGEGSGAKCDKDEVRGGAGSGTVAEVGCEYAIRGWVMREVLLQSRRGAKAGYASCNWSREEEKGEGMGERQRGGRVMEGVQEEKELRTRTKRRR